ncbi:MAG TPA: 4-hydroxy-tetrahydrodipicolinate synthase [Holosporales bacterium]|nr:4-hydroxy-tetrahydrodipicolinate synthase [Holosporales bacterium]
MFKGALTALMTPYKEGKIDLDALRHLVDWQIKEGIDGLVVCGSTGEAFFLSHDEQKQVIETTLEVAHKRVPVIAGTSALTLDETLVLTKQAESLSVDGSKIDGLMVVTPPYMKPTQAALYEYFKAIHDNTTTPIVLYDNPGRSARDINNATVIELAKLPRIVCLKDATGDLTRPSTLLEKLPASFTLLSGEDATAPAYFAQGGVGVVSVSSNVAPNLVATQWKAWCDGDLTRLSETRTLLNPLHRAMFVESNPAPAKYALSRFGFCLPDVRKPLTTLTKPAKDTVDQAIDHAGLHYLYASSLGTHHG